MKTFFPTVGIGAGNAWGCLSGKLAAATNAPSWRRCRFSCRRCFFGLLLPLLLGSMLPGCRSARPRPPAPTVAEPILAAEIAGTTIPVLSMERVRYGESVKAYYYNRYADPSDNNVMYEGGVLYRREETPKWNTRPNMRVDFPVEMYQGIEYNAGETPLTAEFRHQLEQQRQASAALIQQNEVLLETLARARQAAEKATVMEARGQQLEAIVQHYQQQIQALERRLAELEGAPAAGSVPAAAGAAAAPRTPAPKSAAGTGSAADFSHENIWHD